VERLDQVVGVTGLLPHSLRSRIDLIALNRHFDKYDQIDIGFGEDKV